MPFTYDLCPSVACARSCSSIASVADAVAARRHSPKRIMLSFGEWNVWYRARSGADMHPVGWPEQPRLLEEVYNVEDALVVGGALIVLMNRSDRVKVACLAQLVNRHLSEEMDLRVELRGLGSTRKVDHAIALHHRDLQLTNRKEAPDAVVPQAGSHVVVDGESLTARLAPASWNVIVTTAH